jgi:cold shock CspA family protein
MRASGARGADTGTAVLIRARGRIVAWREDRGFGFILRDGRTTPDTFVHIKDVVDSRPLAVGVWVEFDLERKRRGPRALRVRVLQ